VLIEDPELAVLHELDFNEKQMELNLKVYCYTAPAKQNFLM